MKLTVIIQTHQAVAIHEMERYVVEAIENYGGERYPYEWKFAPTNFKTVVALDMTESVPKIIFTS